MSLGSLKAVAALQGIETRMLTAKAAGGNVPTVLRGLTPQERLLSALLYGSSAALGLNMVGHGLLGIPASIFAGAWRNWWIGMQDAKKMRLLQEALFDPKASQLLQAMRHPATDPRWMHTALYSTLTRLGMFTQEAESP